MNPSTSLPAALPTPADPDLPGVGTGARFDLDEHEAWTANGALGVLGGLVLLAVAIPAMIRADSTIGTASTVLGLGGAVLMVAAILTFAALTVVSPGETKVVQLFGRYVGTVRRNGLVLTPPLTSRRRVSVRVRNFETSGLKVNDADGNPVDIAAIVVWRVADTAHASFAVESFTDFVEVQAEAALRHVATSHPYDNADEGEATLRGSTEQVSHELAVEVAARVAIAGIEVVEARISHLAYAPEIAQAMLQRQQAGAIIAAREKIVEGAVSMVETALARLEQHEVVTLDEERKAAMVSNLLVVLCGDSRATPVVNAGSLYT
ncbi:SPFH domain-containing protein [Cellulomonas soli]|uniref:SPFH domain-containing protein n=1 Tax=Cellulomonas soli TaxID=931535 RepID=UPI003F877990